jgi:probable F420-dependent oxidoreductase
MDIPVRFSFNLYGIATTEMLALATTGEKCGFDGAWLGDHVLVPRELRSEYPYASTPGANPLDGAVLNDVWVAVGAMLAATSSLHIGTGVYVLPQRNPFLTALAASTAQAVSGGRFRLGVGAGWMREEFELLDHDFESRGGRTDETIEVLRLLWRGGFQSYVGKHFAFTGVRSSEAQPPVPIIVGGATPPAIRRAASLGDGWYSTANLTLKEAVAIRDQIDQRRAELDRTLLPFDHFVRLGNPVRADHARQFIDAGFRNLTVGTNALWRDATSLRQRLDVLERLGDELVGPLV